MTEWPDFKSDPRKLNFLMQFNIYVNSIYLRQKQKSRFMKKTNTQIKSIMSIRSIKNIALQVTYVLRLKYETWTNNICPPK